MKLSKNRNKKPYIDMLPLIDIVFLVLVVFIYAMLSMVVHRGVPVDLPAAKTAVTDQEEYLSVSIKANGMLYWDKQPVTLEELALKLNRLTAGQKEKPFYLNADKAVPHGRVLSVLDLIRLSAVKKVVIEAIEQNGL